MNVEIKCFHILKQVPSGIMQLVVYKHYKVPLYGSTHLFDHSLQLSWDSFFYQEEVIYFSFK